MTKDKKHLSLTKEFAARRFPPLKGKPLDVVDCALGVVMVNESRFIHVPSVTCDDFPLSILSHCCFRLTFVWTSKNPGLLRGLALQGASLTDSYQEAVVHVVEDVANPGQRVSWCARLGGHLIITPRLAQGSWIQCLDSIVTNLSYHGSKYGRVH